MGLMGNRRALLSAPLPVPTLDLNFLAGMPSGLTFTRASAAWSYNSSGVLTSYATDVPRFDHDPSTLQPRGLLIEESRTNLLLQSQIPSDAAWTKANATAVAAPGAGPGSAAATALTETAAAGVHNANQTLSVTSGTAYTSSIYAKANGRSALQIFYFSTGFGTAHFANYDLAAGVLGTVGGSATATISPAGNGWCRCTLTATATATTASSGVGFSTATAPTNTRNQSFTGDAGLGLLLWQGQAEAGAFATSPIVTSGSTVTRAADTCSMPVGGWYSQAAGSLLAEATLLQASPSGVQLGLVRIDDGTDANRILLFVNAAGSSLYAFTSLASATGINANLGSYTAPQTVKLALAWSSGSSAWSKDGGPAGSSSTTNVPTAGLARMLLGGSSVTPGSWALNGHLRRVAYHPRRLPDGTLQALAR